MAKSFFHVARGLIKWGVLLVAVAVVVVLYLRGAFDPAPVWWEAWRGQDKEQKVELTRMEGEVVRVLGGGTVQLRSEGGKLYSVGLTGVEAPNVSVLAPRSERQAGKKAEQALEEMVLSNRVTVEMTSSNALNSALGIIYRGETNVNAELVRRGLVELREEYIEVVPVKQRFELLWAERQSQERNGEGNGGVSGRSEAE